MRDFLFAGEKSASLAADLLIERVLRKGIYRSTAGGGLSWNRSSKPRV
jgi:hypothetical protein